MTQLISITLPDLQATTAQVEKALGEGMWKLRSNVHLDLGYALLDVVYSNFGATGMARPIPWPMLSPAYAKKVGRTYATLEVTGALKGSLGVDNSNFDFVRVFATDATPYSTVHQYGGGNNIPARPYFPMDSDNELTPQAMDILRDAAERSVANHLRKAFS
jgi:phage gpG-like protein